MLRLIAFALLWTATAVAHAQTVPDAVVDSLYIQRVEDSYEPDKVLHAEPLYIDLIRDLGARKGEKEWNVGLGLQDNGDYDSYTALVEYEWAPLNRLGLEVELPFSIYYPTGDNRTAPGSQLDALKVAAQYSFYVSEKNKTSLAIGYIHEFSLPEFRRYGRGRLYRGNVHNPFFVAAKRWGSNFHTLLYTGPQLHTYVADGPRPLSNWQVNTSLHYMIAGTRNFVGVEFNKNVEQGDFDMTVRPQMRVEITKSLLVGIITGIPMSRENERFSTFLRLIYEPGHQKFLP